MQTPWQALMEKLENIGRIKFSGPHCVQGVITEESDGSPVIFR